MEHCVVQSNQKERLDRLILKLAGHTKILTKMAARLLRAKRIILELSINPDDAMLKELQLKLTNFGITDFTKAWTAIKKVWASKFNERAFLATKKLGLSLS